MVDKKCTSKVFPCPAGDRCPEYVAYMELMAKENFGAAVTSVLKNKAVSSRGGNRLKIPSEVASPSTEAAINLRQGLFMASNRTYGETYMEPVIRRILGLTKPSISTHDAVDAKKGQKYEIKASKVLLGRAKTENNNLFDKVISNAELDQIARIVSFANRFTADYAANIQNVKRDHFDYLSYSLLFSEGVEIFKIEKKSINKEAIANWSDKHGLYDEHGKSGQFSIKRSNIADHEKNYLHGFFTYEELVPFFKEA